MLRADYKESISQAVSAIRDMPSLEGRSKAAIAQAVVLRLLAAAGWDIFDLSQVMPGYITGNRSIDFALMSPGQPRGAVPPRVFIDVRTAAENIESPRKERQLLALCAREEVPLAALTNGLRWLLFLWSPEGGRMERRFCEIDLIGDPEPAAAAINRYLTRDRVCNGQAASITTTDCQICCLTLRIRLPTGYRGRLIASRCQVQIVRENRPARETVVVILN